MVKSLYRVPIPMTTSARRAKWLAAGEPVAPIAPRFSGWSNGNDPLPAWVSLIGMPVASTNARSSSLASA